MRKKLILIVLIITVTIVGSLPAFIKDLSNDAFEMNVSTQSIQAKDNSQQLVVLITYDWKKLPFFRLNDEVTISWGGNFAFEKCTASNVYYSFSNVHGFDSMCKETDLSNDQIDSDYPERCVVKVNGSKERGLFPKSGNIQLTLTNKETIGKETKIIVQYRHEKFALINLADHEDESIVKFGTTYELNTPIKVVVGY